MNFDFRQGIYFTFSAIGALFCISSILSPAFVGMMIFFFSALFGIIFFRKQLLEIRKQEIENKVFEKYGYIWMEGDAVQKWTPEPPRTTIELEKTIQTDEPVQTGFEGENQLLDMDRVGEYQGQKVKIPAEIWPAGVNLESEQITYLKSLDWGMNQISFAVYGMKNGSTLGKIKEILGV